MDCVVIVRMLNIDQDTDMVVLGTLDQDKGIRTLIRTLIID